MSRGPQITGKPSVRSPEGCPVVPYRPPCLGDSDGRIRLMTSIRLVRRALLGEYFCKRLWMRKFPGRHGP